MTQQPVEEGVEEKEPARPEDVTLVRVRGWTGVPQSTASGNKASGRCWGTQGHC